MAQPCGWSDQANAARREDLTWMAETGASATEAARRLGTTYTALEKWCRRRCPETWRVLLAREPVAIDAPTRRRSA